MVEGDGEEVGNLGNDFLGLEIAIVSLHDSIIKSSGGVFGEDTAKLSSAVHRPFQSVYGKRLYTTPLEYAAVLFHGIICGHVFTDGCKRTATMLAAAIIDNIPLLDHPPTPDEIRQMEGIALQAAMPGGISVSEIIGRFEAIFPSANGVEIPR